MTTLSVSVRYRPIRIGWCVREGDLAALREVLKLTFTMWGGRYNPVIPVDNFDLAGRLVRLFRVDVLWPASNDELVKQFIARFPHLPSPFLHNELFSSHPNGRRSPLMVDIYHPIRRLYEDHFKNNALPKVNVAIFEWQADDPMGDVLLQMFGAIPPPEVTGTDYCALLKRDLSARAVPLAPSQPLPELTDSIWPLSAFSRAFVSQHYSVQNYREHPGFYIGDCTQFEDLVTFWNLRATDTALIFYDYDHAPRLDPIRDQWLKMLRSRPKGRLELDNAIALWCNADPQPDLSAFGDGLLLHRAHETTWNGLNIKAPYMYFSEGSALAAIGENSAGVRTVSFQLPQKPFSEDRTLFHQHLVVAVDPGIGLFGEERATLHTPYVPQLNEYYGRHCYFEWNKARVEPKGLGIISDAARFDLSLNALDVSALISRLFGVAGIAAEPSQPGLIAARLIQQMGGLLSCYPFKLPGVRNLIEKYNPDQSFTRGGATQMIHAALGDAPIHFGKPDANAIFDRLLANGVFRAGLEFHCPSCRLEFWTPLDDVRTGTTCVYCGRTFNVTPQLKDRDWRFRRSGLFGRRDHQEGALPVVLTLQQLDTTFGSREMLYTTAMTLKPTRFKMKQCETDFVAIVQHPMDAKISVAIGECKTRQTIVDDDVAKLKGVADAFPDDFSVFIIFSKLSAFTPDELTAAQRLNDGYQQRVILFTPRELETYHLYDRTAEEFKINPHAFTFEEMANVTQQVFFREATTNAPGA